MAAFSVIQWFKVRFMDVAEIVIFYLIALCKEEMAVSSVKSDARSGHTVDCKLKCIDMHMHSSITAAYA